MKKWDERPNEVKYLLNPAFCGRILFSMINEYQKTANRAVPFPLLFMVLPLILHEDTRNAISRSTQLYNGPRNPDHIFQNHREHGMIKKTQRRDKP